MAREIETRFKLTEEQRVLFLRWIETNATFASETHHIEHYLRVRFDEKKGDSVCLKIFKIDQKNQTSENLSETEFAVESGEQVLTLFKLLGYSKATIVDKTRRKYLSNDH